MPSISPPSGPSNPNLLNIARVATSPFGPHPKSTSKSGVDGNPEVRAQEAEKEAQQRITRSEKMVQETEREAGQELDRVKDDYQVQANTESAREDALIEKQKNKGYEAIRDLQRLQQAEMGRVRREGDRDLSKLDSYYRDTAYVTEKHGEEKIRDSEKMKTKELEYQVRLNRDEVDTTRKNHSVQIDQLKEYQEGQVAKINDSYHKDYERLNENSAEAHERAQANFQSKFKTLVDGQEQTLTSVNNRASEKVKQIRNDFTQKLSAYADRQKDPFYKMVDTGAKLHDKGEYFELTATIPTHEQEHVSASVKGNQIQITGYRRNEEKLDIGPGHTKGTASYQSFSESFPLTWPVDSHRLAKEFDGDTMIIRVPKKNEFVYVDPRKPAAPEKAKLERPSFPENIPHVKADPLASDSDPAPQASQSSPGSKPLV